MTHSRVFAHLAVERINSENFWPTRAWQVVGEHGGTHEGYDPNLGR